ncbi:MAG: hypothetical protein U0136_10020 [Bdellovibrionota bacterium]
MKLSSIPAILVLFLASLVPFLVSKGLDAAIANYSIQYQIRDLLKSLNSGPWQPVVFGLSFGLAIRALSQQHNRATREEVFAFTLLCALVKVCLLYGGALIIGFLALAHIPPLVFMSTLEALFLALIAWKGLYVNLGGLGVFLTTLLGLAIGVVLTLYTGFPINVSAHWYTIVGTFMGLFAALDRA